MIPHTGPYIFDFLIKSFKKRPCLRCFSVDLYASNWPEVFDTPIKPSRILKCNKKIIVFIRQIRNIIQSFCSYISFPKVFKEIAASWPKFGVADRKVFITFLPSMKPYYRPNNVSNKNYPEYKTQ